MKKDFTLIKLIAGMVIVGGLSMAAFIFIQGQVARSKSVNQTTTSLLHGLMSLAEIHHYDNGGTYANLCNYVGNGGITAGAGCVSATSVNKKICDTARKIKEHNGGTYPSCSADTGSWAISSPLRSSVAIWCVDYNLISGLSLGFTNAPPYSCIRQISKPKWTWNVFSIFHALRLLLLQDVLPSREFD